MPLIEGHDRRERVVDRLSLGNPARPSVHCHASKALLPAGLRDHEGRHEGDRSQSSTRIYLYLHLQCASGKSLQRQNVVINVNLSLNNDGQTTLIDIFNRILVQEWRSCRADSRYAQLWIPRYQM